MWFHRNSSLSRSWRASVTCCCSCAPSASAEVLIANPCIASSYAVAASFSYWRAAVVRALKIMVRSASVSFDIYFLHHDLRACLCATRLALGSLSPFWVASARTYLRERGSPDRDQSGTDA